MYHLLFKTICICGYLYLKNVYKSKIWFEANAYCGQINLYIQNILQNVENYYFY